MIFGKIFILFSKNNFTRINHYKFIHHESHLKPFLSYLPCIVHREYFSIIFNVKSVVHYTRKNTVCKYAYVHILTKGIKNENLKNRVTRRLEKNTQSLEKSCSNGCQPTNCQNIYIKAQFESPNIKILLKPKNTLSKPFFQTAYLGENVKTKAKKTTKNHTHLLAIWPEVPL